MNGITPAYQAEDPDAEDRAKAQYPRFKRSLTWDAQREHAAQLLAQGDLTDAQIAKQVGVAKTTLYHWRQHPEFAQRVEQNVEELKQKIADQSFEIYKAKANWRDSLIEQLTAIVTSFTANDLETIKKNPIATINLLLRLQNNADSIERRRERFEDPDDYPFEEDVSPETAERIMEAIERAREA